MARIKKKQAKMLSSNTSRAIYRTARTEETSCTMLTPISRFKPMPAAHHCSSATKCLPLDGLKYCNKESEIVLLTKISSTRLTLLDGTILQPLRTNVLLQYWF